MACCAQCSRNQIRSAYKAYAQAAMKAIRAERCEEIWSEVVNRRVGSKAPAQDSDEQHKRDSFEATFQALSDGGFEEQAALFKKVTDDPEAWEQYSRATFEALLEAAPEQKDRKFVVGEKEKATQPKKLWWLHYPRDHESIDEYWERQQVNGVLLLGPHAGTWRKSKEKAAAGQDVEHSGSPGATRAGHTRSVHSGSRIDQRRASVQKCRRTYG